METVLLFLLLQNLSAFILKFTTNSFAVIILLYQCCIPRRVVVENKTDCRHVVVVIRCVILRLDYLTTNYCPLFLGRCCVINKSFLACVDYAQGVCNRYLILLRGSFMARITFAHLKTKLGRRSITLPLLLCYCSKKQRITQSVENENLQPLKTNINTSNHHQAFILWTHILCCWLVVFFCWACQLYTMRDQR